MCVMTELSHLQLLEIVICVGRENGTNQLLCDFVNPVPFASIMQSGHTSLSLHGHTPLLQPAVFLEHARARAHT